MKNKTVLIVCALPAELASVKLQVKKLGLVGIKIKFFLSGVGNYKALYNLKSYLDNQEETIDFIINIGLAGRNSEAENNYFQVYRILGAANGRELLCPIYINHLKKYSILSSERVITDHEKMYGEKYVDMESYAIDLVATEEKIPYIIIKKPFDIISNDSKNIDPKMFENCLGDFNFGKLLEDINTYLTNNYDSEEEKRVFFLTETLKIYKLTFSEKEIWKKSYAKLISSGGDYEAFLTKHSTMQKRDFLNELTEN